MKTQKQIIVPPETNSVNCPYCERKNTIEYKKPFWILGVACPHTSMAVDAGQMEIAIQFYAI